jgi:hypothetical protein
LAILALFIDFGLSQSYVDNTHSRLGNSMDTALTVIEQPPALPAELIAPLKLAADFAKASKAPGHTGGLR